MPDQFIYQLRDTWSDAATSFVGIGLDVTDTASAAGSLLLDLDVGGVQRFAVRKDGVVTVAGAEVTANAPLLNLSQTWNAAGVAFTGLRFNATDTASAAGSLLVDLQVGGASRFSVRKDGFVSAFSEFSAPTISSRSNSGAFAIGASLDVVLTRDAANTLAQRNGANAQGFNLYNTFTDASNYERGQLRWSGGELQIATNSAGTGVNRALAVAPDTYFRIYTGGGARWDVNASGHILAQADAAYDIGAAGANRPRHLHLGGLLFHKGRFVQDATTDGVIVLYNNAQTDFGRVMFGGTTSSFPALKRFSTQLQVRLADDSGFADIVARQAAVGGTVETTSRPALDLTQTWNAAGVAFTGLRANITDTASAAGSLLVDLQVGGTSRLGIRKDGAIISGVGVGRPFVAIGGSNSGFQLSNNGSRGMTVERWDAASVASFTDAGCSLALSMGIAPVGAGPDVFLVREAANTLGQRNGVSPQAFNIYNTFTDASNYERGFFRYSANALEIGHEAAGTGTSSRQILFRTNGATYFAINASTAAVWNINTSGHWLAGSDGVYDIGAAGANRPRSIFVSDTVTAGNFFAGATGTFIFTGRSRINSDVDGNLRIANNAGTGFGRLQFGGQTSAFPALRRNAAALEARLADDSGDADFSARVVRTPALTVATLPAAATAGAGARAFVSDANATTFASVVAGGGANGVPVYSDGTSWRIG